MSNKSMKSRTERELKPKLRFPEFRGGGSWAQAFGSELFRQVSNKQHDSTLPLLAITQEHGAIPRDMFEYKVFVTEKSIESYKVVDIGDFIISLRSFQGGIEYSNYQGLCSPAYIVLRPKHLACSAYFKQFFKSQNFIRELTKNIEGLRDGKMVSYQQFSDLKLPITTEAEQQKIASCLSSIDEVVDAQIRKLEMLKNHKSGLMKALFPQVGEVAPHLRFQEFSDAPGWNTTVLGEVSAIASGGTPSRTRKDFWNGNIPWVTTSLIDFNFIDVVDEYISKSGLDNSSAKIFPSGTILMAMYGQGITRGKVALLNIDAATNQACAAIIIKEKIDRTFAFQYLSCHYENIRNMSNSGGQENLSLGLIEKIPFSFPSIEEQQKISNFLSSIDKLIAAQAQKTDALKLHKKGLLQQLFPAIEEVKG